MAVDALTRHRFTLEEWERLGRLGFFSEDDRVELIDGEIVDMAPAGPRHANCVKQLNRLLSRQVGDAAVVSVQDPIRVSEGNQPQPDLALLRPPLDRYAQVLPAAKDVLLVIEVADTSLVSDRDTKARIYGEAGIPEYWLVDLNADRVVALTRPGAKGYEQSRTAAGGEILAPILVPDVAVPVTQSLGLG